MEKRKLSVEESFSIGALTGIAEVTATLPLFNIKTRNQCGLKFTLNPTVLYRGYYASLASMIFISSIEVASASFIENTLTEKSEKNVSHTVRILSSFSGGALLGIVFNPLELISTQYHKHNYPSYKQATLNLFNKVGVRGLFIGAPATAFTDGIFVCGFFGLYPFLKAVIQKNIDNEKIAAPFAGVTSGLIASVFSHPTDMIRSNQQYQADVARKSIRTVIGELYSKKNKVGFFKGFLPRTIWMTSAVGIAGLAAERIEPIVCQNNNVFK